MPGYASATPRMSSLTSLLSEDGLSDNGNEAQSNDKSTPPGRGIPTPLSNASHSFSPSDKSDVEWDAYIESHGEDASEDNQQQTHDEDRAEYEPHDWRLEAEYRLNAVQQLRTSLTTNYTRSVDRSRALHRYAKKNSSNADDAQAYLWQYREDIPQFNNEDGDELAGFGAKMERDWFYTKKGEVKWIAEEQERLFGHWSWPRDDDTQASWPVDVGPKNELVEVVTPLPKELTREGLRQDSAVSLRSMKDREMEPLPKKRRGLVIHPPRAR